MSLVSDIMEEEYNPLLNQLRNDLDYEHHVNQLLREKTILCKRYISEFIDVLTGEGASTYYSKYEDKVIDIQELKNFIKEL